MDMLCMNRVSSRSLDVSVNVIAALAKITEFVLSIGTTSSAIVENPRSLEKYVQKVSMS